jgi:hypothetical protein
MGHYSISEINAYKYINQNKIQPYFRIHYTEILNQ